MQPSPRVGVVRDSMLANPLLGRPLLGRSRTRGLMCPGPDFVYGMPTTVQDGGVSQALSDWRVHSVPSSGYHGVQVRDFVSLNRDGVRSGLVTAKEHYQYRAQRANQEAARTVPTATRSRVPTLRPLPDTVFGIATRPSSPMLGLLEHQYARRWLEEQQAKHRTKQEKQVHKPKLGRILDTRTSLLRKSCPLTETTPLWKLSRFEQVAPALDTFRDPEARRRAFKAHHSESVSRRGVQGQGTYTVG
ncbi:cilia- and flagella-associated protein 77 [Aplochiton taeniatus]